MSLAPPDSRKRGKGERVGKRRVTDLAGIAVGGASHADDRDSPGAHALCGAPASLGASGRPQRRQPARRSTQPAHLAADGPGDTGQAVHPARSAGPEHRTAAARRQRQGGRLQFPENAGGKRAQGHGEPRILQCFQWEVKAMQVTVTLRGGARFAALLHRLEQEVDQRGAGPRLDRRNRRTWRQLVLGVVVKRSTRLLALRQIVAPQRRAGSVKAAAQGVAYFLRQAKFPSASFSLGLLEEAVRQVDPARLVTYKGKVLVVLDPTEYEKRSRERGKCGRQMEHIGRVRRSKSMPQKKRTTGPAQQHGGGG